MAMTHRPKQDMTEPTPNPLFSSSKISSPIPDDILFQIFLIIVKETEDSWDALLHPSSVCRQWRAHCLSQPHLWSYFHFHHHRCKGRAYIDPVIVNPDYGDLPLTRLQLERSGTSPLFINADNFCYPCHLIHYAKFRLLLEHAHRWKTARIPEVQIGGRYGNSTEVLIPRSTTFPALEKLSWAKIGDLPDFESPDAALPSLISLNLNRSHCGISSNVIPWDKLKYLRIGWHSATLPDLLSLLSRTRSLIQLELSYLEEEDPPIDVPKNLDTVTLPHLINLYFFDLTGNLVHVIPHLITPSLKALWTQHYESDAYIHAVTNLIRTSSCMLTDLYWEIPNTGVDATALAALLRECPALESLMIQKFSTFGPLPLTDTADLCNIRDVLSSSVPTQDSDGHDSPTLRLICPRLTWFTLARMKFDLPILFEILERRLSSTTSSGDAGGEIDVAGLTNVRIIWPIERWDEDDRYRPHADEIVEFERNKALIAARMEEHVAGGLDLKIL